MRAIELHKVLRDAREIPPADNVVHADFTDTDDVGENRQAAARSEPVVEPMVTQLVVVNVETIRCFNPRKEGNGRGPGTRLTFIDGGGYAVSETYEEVKQALVRSGAASITPAEGVIGQAN